LTVLLSSHAREQVDCRDIIIGPSELGLKPSGLRHTDYLWRNGVRALRIILQPSLFITLPETQTELEQWTWLKGPHLFGALLNVARGILAKDPSVIDDYMTQVRHSSGRMLPRLTNLPHATPSAAFVGNLNS